MSAEERVALEQSSRKTSVGRGSTGSLSRCMREIRSPLWPYEMRGGRCESPLLVCLSVPCDAYDRCLTSVGFLSGFQCKRPAAHPRTLHF